MLDWITPVTDRTNEDTRQARANLGASTYNKGALQHTDLNRIENNLQVLNEMLKENKVFFDFNSKLNWKEIDLPWLTEINRIRNNCNSIIFVYLSGIIGGINQGNYFDYVEANKIEEVSQISYEVLKALKGYHKRSGTMASNQSTLPQNAFLGRTWGELDALNWNWQEWNTKTWYTLVY